MRALATPAAPAATKTGPPTGYRPAERREMDRLMQSLPQ
jgi:hypothetical protein